MGRQLLYHRTTEEALSSFLNTWPSPHCKAVARVCCFTSLRGGQQEPEGQPAPAPAPGPGPRRPGRQSPELWAQGCACCHTAGSQPASPQSHPCRHRPACRAPLQPCLSVPTSRLLKKHLAAFTKHASPRSSASFTLRDSPCGKETPLPCAVRL